jgi:hypothetical protein
MRNTTLPGITVNIARAEIWRRYLCVPEGRA